MKKCEHCDKDLASWRSSRARFCSVRCRVSRHRASRRMPAELKKRTCWVRRDAMKRPLTTSGTLASVNASDGWTTYREAKASTAGVGMGFVLDGSGIGVIDLDHAFDSAGKLHPWAAEVLEANPGTFTEISQSGNGLHIWGHMAPRRGQRLRDGRNIEIYSMGRYMAMGTPLRGTTAKLKPLIIPV
ncbi:hypothetical protein [Glutamicibacter sp. NPDC087344]|uniref:hypothetical protein n=1 Tax=Glutamicibacter sp. NPDC087344 TaxID=3363994 RepID=UPI00382D2441